MSVDRKGQFMKKCFMMFILLVVVFLGVVYVDDVVICQLLVKLGVQSMEIQVLLVVGMKIVFIYSGVLYVIDDGKYII